MHGLASFIVSMFLRGDASGCSGLHPPFCVKVEKDLAPDSSETAELRHQPDQQKWQDNLHHAEGEVEGGMVLAILLTGCGSNLSAI